MNSYKILFLFSIMILSLFFCVFFLNLENKFTYRRFKKFKEINDMHKCPNTANYFSHFQSSYGPIYIATAFTFFNVFFFISLLLLLKYSSDQLYNVLNMFNIISLSLIISIISLFELYKIQFCVIARMCKDSCSDPFFKKN